MMFLFELTEDGGSPGLDLDVGACSESRLGGASMTAGEALTYRWDCGRS